MVLRPAWILWGLLGAALAGHGASPAAAQSTLNAIERVEYAALHGGRVAVRVELRHALKQTPTGFRVFHPAARIVLEFPGTTVATPQRAIQIDGGVLRSVHLVQQGSHTRLVMNLVRAVAYETVIEGTSLTIVLDKVAKSARTNRVLDVVFRLGANREGRVIVQLSMPGSAIGIREQGRQLVVDFPETGIEPGSLRRLDVLDFATPVASIATHTLGDGVRIVIEPLGRFEYAAYQSGTELVIAFTPRPPYPLSGL